MPIADAQYINISETSINNNKNIFEDQVNRVVGTIVWLLNDRKKLSQVKKRLRKT